MIEFCGKHNIPFTIIRPSNVYGPRGMAIIVVPPKLIFSCRTRFCKGTRGHYVGFAPNTSGQWRQVESWLSVY